MVLSAVIFLDSKGKHILSRDYRGDVNIATSVTRFNSVLAEWDEHELKPVFLDEDTSYLFMRHNGLYIVGVTRSNANAALCFTFLRALVGVLEDYFDTLNDESLRDNFVVVYELLDEVMDHGYPQATDAAVLKEFIKTTAYALEKPLRPPPALTMAVSWRAEGISYRRDEIFLDVVERVRVLVAANGTVLQSEVHGSIECNCQLSGMPEVRVGLNDKVQFDARFKDPAKKAEKGTIDIDDVAMHQAVNLALFDRRKEIVLVPPDGKFTLMSYRLLREVRPLVAVEAVVDEHKNSRLEFLVKAKSLFKQRAVAQDVCIYVPVPLDASNPRFRANYGSVSYLPEKDAILWFIKAFPGQREFLMRASFSLPSVRDAESANRPPIQVGYNIPSFTISGLQIRFLKVSNKTGQAALSWVRYMTLAEPESYLLRLN